MSEAFWERQRAFAARVVGGGPGLESGVIVVLPSATFPPSELAKIVGIQHYEERLLYLTLLLGRPDVRIVYPTSLPVDDAVVDYYLGFLPHPAAARRRLTLVPVGDPEPVVALTAKLLAHPEAVEALRQAAGDPAGAYLLPFNVTPLELELADRLGLPVFGPHPDQAALGSKSGSRKVAYRAGVPVVAGDEDLWSVDALERAVAKLQARRPELAAIVVKLNNGFSGQGHAIIAADHLTAPLDASPTTFCAAGESWPSFAAKVAGEGAVVEELLRRPGQRSPSVQMRIRPGGEAEVVSTHDQILGGPDDQVYLGCRFPARAEYRSAIRAPADRVGRVLASEGVIGPFGIDFLVLPGENGGPDVCLSEINLRMGGTTHPFGMARLATGGTYDPDRGELVAGGRAKAYVATDNLKSPSLVGRTPASVIEAVERAGLAFRADRATGTTLHLMGALRDHGKCGMTCIADSPDDAYALYAETAAVLGSLPP